MFLPAPAAPGDLVWKKRYDGPAFGYDGSTAIASTPDGTKVFVTGWSQGPEGHDLTTIAYRASTGTKLWVRRYDGPADGNDYGGAVWVSDERVFVTGHSKGPDGFDYVTLAYRTGDGAKLWKKRYQGPSGIDDLPEAITGSGNKIFVTGLSGADFATVAYRAGTGAKVWVSRYDGPPGGDDYATAIATSPTGDVVVVSGYSESHASGFDYATIAYGTATGTKLWTRRLDGPADGDDYAAGVAVGGAKVFVTGTSEGGATGTDHATVAYQISSGTKIWESRFDGIAGADDSARAIAIAGKKVFVTGSQEGLGTGRDYMTVAYRAGTGVELWAKRYGEAGNGYDSAHAIATAGKRVFVTGSSAGATSGSDFATLAYMKGSGALLWVKRYDGPGSADDSASSISASTEQELVFITGTSIGSTPDFATIAYEAA
jgi:outer membrane protein assembly factor BamB